MDTNQHSTGSEGHDYQTRLVQIVEDFRAVNTSLTYLAALISRLEDRIATIEWRQEWEVNAWRELWKRYADAEEWKPPEPGSSMPVRRKGAVDRFRVEERRS